MEGESVLLGITGAKDLAFRMGGNEKEAIFVEAINTLENVAEVEFADFGDILFFIEEIEIIFFDGIDLIFGLIDGFFFGLLVGGLL